MQTVVSTGLWLARTEKRRSLKSRSTGGLVSGSGYGTTCGTTSVMRDSRRSARAPACLSARRVRSTDVKTTVTSNLWSVSPAGGFSGRLAAGASVFSKASDISFHAPICELPYRDYTESAKEVIGKA